MQTDLLPELSPSGGYKNIMAGIGVFSRYLFAYPVSSHTAVNTAKLIVHNISRKAFLPTVTITDKGLVVVSNLIHEIADVLSITLRHATRKHAQTIVV